MGPGPSIDDPADAYNAFLLSDGSQNFGKWSNGQVDRMLRDQDSILDAAKRRGILWDVQRVHLTEFPNVVLFWQGSTLGTRPEVSGYIVPLFSVTTALRLEEVWLNPA